MDGGRGHEQQLGVDVSVDLALSASNPKVNTPGNTIMRIEIGPRALSLVNTVFTHVAIISSDR